MLQRFDAVQRLAERLGPSDQVVVGDDPQHGQRRRRAHRVAAEGAAVQARSQQLRGRAGREARADRQAATEALGQRDDIGSDAVVLVGEKCSGAADTGLHLVEDQQRAVAGGDLAGGGQITGGGTTTPLSPMIGSRNTAAVSSPTAAASASTSP